MTISFSSITSLNSRILGGCLVACSCGCTNGGATRLTCCRGSLSSSPSAGAAASASTIAAVPANAARRDIIVCSFPVLIHRDRGTLHDSPAGLVALQQTRLRKGRFAPEQRRHVPRVFSSE